MESVFTVLGRLLQQEMNNIIILDEYQYATVTNGVLRAKLEVFKHLSDYDLVKLDMKNAYNSISRRAIEESLRS